MYNTYFSYPSMPFRHWFSTTVQIKKSASAITSGDLHLHFLTTASDSAATVCYYFYLHCSLLLYVFTKFLANSINFVVVTLKGCRFFQASTVVAASSGYSGSEQTCERSKKGREPSIWKAYPSPFRTIIEAFVLILQVYGTLTCGK